MTSIRVGQGDGVQRAPVVHVRLYSGQAGDEMLKEHRCKDTNQPCIH